MDTANAHRRHRLIRSLVAEPETGNDPLAADAALRFRGSARRNALVPPFEALFVHWATFCFSRTYSTPFTLKKIAAAWSSSLSPYSHWTKCRTADCLNRC